jgi:hypothetical protein
MKTLINEIEYTEMEMEMLKVFYESSVDICGGCSDEENMSYNNAHDLKAHLGGTKQAIGGVMTSLLKKGAICDTQESPRGSKLNDFVLADDAVMEYFDTE